MNQVNSLKSKEISPEDLSVHLCTCLISFMKFLKTAFLPFIMIGCPSKII